jgi:hypothetical protein
MEINALTRVGALLEAHPELEAPLIAFVPAFEKLRNPILRATVAKLATLEQAAKVGGIPLPELLAFLHRTLGQTGPLPEAAAPGTPGLRPPWHQTEAVVAELDATALLATGTHPLALVKQTLASHVAGAIVVVRSDFEPAPLLAQMTKDGYQVACWQEGAGFVTSLRKP